MQTNQAQAFAFGTVVLIVAAGTFTDVITKKNKQFDSVPRRIFGAIVLGILLMLLAIPAPKLTAALSGLIAVAYMFISPGGTEFLKRLNDTLGGSVDFGQNPPYPAGGGGVKPI